MLLPLFALIFSFISILTMFVCKCFSSRPIMKTTPVMYGGEEEKAQSFAEGVDEIIFSYIYASTPVQLKTESLYQFSMKIDYRHIKSTRQSSYYNTMVEYANKGCLKGLKFLNLSYSSEIHDICFITINNGYYDIVKYFNEYDINTYRNLGERVVNTGIIDFAGEKGYLKIYKLFLDDPQHFPNIFLSIERPIQEGYIEIVKYALQSGKRIFPDKNISSLYIAANFGMLDIVNLLLHLDTITDDYEVVIDRAINNGYLGIVKALVLNDQYTKCSNTKYFIDKAALNGYLEIVKFLLDSKCKDACSPLAIQDAAQYGYLEILKVLMEHKKPYYASKLYSQFPEITEYIESKENKS